MEERKKYIKILIIGLLLVLVGGTIAAVKTFGSANSTPLAEEESWWGEGGSAFITESETKVRDPALIDDVDRDWIDVDGMRELLKGKAALVDESNRDWIGKEVTVEPIITPSSEVKEMTEEEAKIAQKAHEQERIDRALDNDYIDDVDEEERYLPLAVNPFATEEKSGYYETPEVIMGSGAIVIFTKPDGTGWDLEEGQTLTFEAEQYPLETTKTRNKGREIVFGYILDGKLHQDTLDENEYHQYSLKAEQEGEYYMTIYCATLLLTLKNGRMEIK